MKLILFGSFVSKMRKKKREKKKEKFEKRKKREKNGEKCDHELANASPMSISSSRNAQDDGEAKNKIFFFSEKKKNVETRQNVKTNTRRTPNDQHEADATLQINQTRKKRAKKKKDEKTYVRETCKENVLL